MIASAPAWQAWRDQISNLVLGSDEATLDGRLAAWRDEVSSDSALQTSPIAGSIYAATMHADLGGQLFVRQVEVPEAGREVANADVQHDPFLRMPFDDALRYFLSRRIVTPAQFAAMSDAARERSFTATSLASDALIARCQELLAESLRNGGTYEDFARDLSTETTTLGIEPSDPGYVENVYRTNVASAYGAGRYKQLSSDAVRAARPFIEFRCVLDSRTRPTHALLHGKFFRQDDPGWPRYAPPLGFQCRCTTVARRAEDVDMSRVVRASDIDFTPDFNAAPSLAL